MKKIILVILVVTLMNFLLVGCDSGQQKEYKLNENQLAVFQETQPIPQISFSNTRDAIVKRIERWSDPNKISYIYLVSYGRVMAFYTVKGSVESKRSYLSPVTKPYGGNGAVVDAPDIDGTYGDNADSVFFFNSDNVYVEWSGDYLWVDQPLQFATQPELMYVAPLK